MPIERYFIDTPLILHTTQKLTGTDFHHMVRVMRTRKGDLVELVNGQGALAQASVLEIAKEHAALTVESVYQELEQPARLILAQGLPKQNKIDFILEKGTELGVDAFWLFPGELSVKRDLYPSQIERARAVTIAAMKQCGRLTLPVIVSYPPLAEWETIPSHTYFGDVSEKAPLFETRWKAPTCPLTPSVFVTGPESGFSAGEKAKLGHLGAMGVKLHNNILRTETASLMALSLMSHWLMESSNTTPL